MMKTENLLTVEEYNDAAKLYVKKYSSWLDKADADHFKKFTVHNKPVPLFYRYNLTCPGEQTTSFECCHVDLMGYIDYLVKYNKLSVYETNNPA